MQTVNEWAIPFVSDLRPKENMFTVEVPLHFCYNTMNAVPNKLYFSKLNLVPDFFNLQAEELDIDTEDTENMNIDVAINLSVIYGQEFLNIHKKRPMYKHGVATREEYVNSVLQFLTYKTDYFAKASFQKYPSFFWDWHDVELDGHLPADEFIKKKIHQPVVENFFYSTIGELNTVHYRKTLMQTNNVENFTGQIINPYEFPTKKVDSSESSLATIRVRFHLQPRTTISFSNSGILAILGFDVKNNQHIKYINRNYVIANNSATEWLHFSADFAPSLANWQDEDEKYPASDTKVQLKTSESFIKDRETSQQEIYTKIASMTYTDFKFTPTLYSKVQEILDEITYQSNVNVAFNAINGKVTLPNPALSENKLSQIFLTFPSLDVANRFNYSQAVINADTEQITSKAVSTALEKWKDLNFDLKAKSLVFDTNLVYVIALDTISSDRMHPLAPGFVASLHPNDGIMEMAVPWYKQPDYFRLAEYQTGNNQIQLKFELYTILNNKQHVKLHWKPGATVCGIIRATS